MLQEGALQQLDEFANLGRHARGGAGRIVDANVSGAAPGAALHVLDAEAQRSRRSMADTRDARRANIRQGRLRALAEQEVARERAKGQVTVGGWNAMASKPSELAPGSWRVQAVVHSHAQLTEAVLRAGFETATASGGAGLRGALASPDVLPFVLKLDS